MDDLEEVWGPRGRATVDPGSVRPVAPTPSVPRVADSTLAPPAARPAVASPPAFTPSQLLIGEIVPTSPAPSARQLPVVWIGAGAAALVAAVLVVALFARSSSEPPAPVVATGTTATTIVSAAADLLGRSQTTVPPADAATTTPAPAPTVAPTTQPPITPMAPAAPTTAPASTVTRPPLAMAEESARRFIDVVSRRDCDGLWALFSRDTQSFLAGSSEPGEPSGRDALCDELRSEETIPPMRVHGPAVAQGDRAAVPLESEGAVEDLHFVVEDGRWVIDLFGDFTDES